MTELLFEFLQILADSVVSRFNLNRKESSSYSEFFGFSVEAYALHVPDLKSSFRERNTKSERQIFDRQNCVFHVMIFIYQYMRCIYDCLL